MALELLAKQELADRFGVDVRTITNWVADGMPERRRSGKPAYAWLDCYRWREEKIREDGRASRHAGGDDNIKKQLADARLRTALAEAEEAELNVAARRGELIPRNFMRIEFSRIAQAFRTALLAVPQSWEPRLAACVSTIDRQLALRDGVNELMPVIRELVDDDGEVLDLDAPAMAAAPDPDAAAG
jgi:phage terminase Nu1 subunit (DNA packaging protein)